MFEGGDGIVDGGPVAVENVTPALDEKELVRKFALILTDADDATA